MENHRAVLTAVALAVTIPRLALFSALGGYLPEPPRDQEIYLRLAGSFLDGEGLSFSVDEHLYKVSNSRSDDPMAAWTADPDLVFGLGRASKCWNPSLIPGLKLPQHPVQEKMLIL